MFAFIQNLGPFELIIILAVVLLLFGRKLPQLARNLGKGIVEFKQGVKDGSSESNQKSDKSTAQ